MNLDRVIGADLINVCALRPALNRGSRNDSEIAHGIHQQVDVHKLIWEKRIVGIVENRLQLVSASGGVNLVVNR